MVTIPNKMSIINEFHLLIKEKKNEYGFIGKLRLHELGLFIK